MSTNKPRSSLQRNLSSKRSKESQTWKQMFKLNTSYYSCYLHIISPECGHSQSLQHPGQYGLMAEERQLLALSYITTDLCSPSHKLYHLVLQRHQPKYPDSLCQSFLAIILPSLPSFLMNQILSCWGLYFALLKYTPALRRCLFTSMISMINRCNLLVILHQNCHSGETL